MNHGETPESIPQPDGMAPAPSAERPQEAGEKHPVWGYEDLAIMAGVALPALLVGQVLVRVVARVLGGWGQAPELLAGQFLGYGLWFIGLYLLLRQKYGMPFWPSLAWVRPFHGIGRNVGWGFLLAVVVTIGGVLLQAERTEVPMKQLLTDRLSLTLMGLAAATLGPLCEELAFRGFLFPLLARSMGAALGIIFTALPFTLLHGPQYGWSWRHLLFVMIAAMSFTWVRHRSGSTAASTVMHATYNMIFFVLYLIQSKTLPAK